MKLNQFFSEAVTALRNENSKSEAEKMIGMVVEKIMEIDRPTSINVPSAELSTQKENELKMALQRLLNHEPVQYIIGEAWFYHLPFTVNADVLIPRPETEELVEKMVNYAKEKKGSILDIGTGSGCIPVAFQKYTEGWDATGIDVSPNALRLAKLNAEKQNVPVRFLEMDFLVREKWSELDTYDIISSNPPYIPESEKENISAGVKNFEPHLALFVPEALLFYKAIAAFGKDHLNPNGKIFMETHQDHAKETAAYFSGEGFKTELVKDISGNERMVLASLFR